MQDDMNILGVKGHVKVEVIDSKSNDLVKIEEGSNGITHFGAYWLKKLAITMVAGGFTIPNSASMFEYGTNYEISNDRPLNLGGWVNAIYLSDSDDAFNAVTDYEFKGEITGFATKEPYTGSDVLRGNLNQNESECNLNRLKLVFDFGTDKANGVHKSINLSKDSDINYRADPYYCFDYNNPVVEFLQHSYDKIFIRDGKMYIAESSTVYIYDLLTKELEKEVNLPRTFHYKNIDVWNNKLYYKTDEDASPLYEYDIDTEVESTLIGSVPGYDGYGMSIVNGKLYYTYNTYRLYEVDLISANVSYSSISVVNSSGLIHRVNDELYWSRYTSSDNADVHKYNESLGDFEEYDGFFPEKLVCSDLADIYGVLEWRYPIYSNYQNTESCILKYNGRNEGMIVARRVFDNPIEKNSTQTMKVTYTVTFA